MPKAAIATAAGADFIILGAPDTIIRYEYSDHGEPTLEAIITAHFA